ncbi:hypothetical protein Tco_1042763 [Tanacetum coccineum]|uniref:Reverse transcriptase domain-containing protein n=1 Tax=Tanacetum coccineum TaxID=301880 RepID=A0ABQ5GKL0_9ASTR
MVPLWLVNSSNTQQPPFKRQNVAQAFTVGNNEKRWYVGSAPYCNKCRLHHEGPYIVKCTNCKKVGYMAWDCKTVVAAQTPRAPIKVASNDARRRAYTLGGGDGNPNFNVVTDVRYTVEFTYGRLAKSDTIIRGCTLNLVNHPFNIDLMPVELCRFGGIIRMDRLSKYHVVIVCDEKMVCIPYGNETLTIRDDKSNKGNNSRLSIISCTKNQKYIHRGCYVFLAQVSVKKTEDKSEENRLKDVPIIQDFLEDIDKHFTALDKSNFKST